MRAYKAKDENIYRTLKDGRYEQMIFRNMELREREIRKLKEFQEWLASKNLSMPKGFEDGVELVRVLSNRQFKFQEVYDAIHKFDKDHRERLLPILRDYEKYLPLLETGFFYAYGRDKAMRPIIYFDVRKYVDSGASIDEMLTVQDIVQTYVVHHAMVPGQIENYHTIVDASNVGYTEIPYTSLARITNHMRDGYFATCFTL